VVAAAQPPVQAQVAPEFSERPEEAAPPVVVMLPIPEIPLPIPMAVPDITEIPAIGVPLSDLVQRLPRTGGATAAGAAGSIGVLGGLLLAVGATLRFRR
jgi:hypothetical protein